MCVCVCVCVCIWLVPLWTQLIDRWCMYVHASAHACHCMGNIHVHVCNVHSMYIIGYIHCHIYSTYVQQLHTGLA